MRVYVSVPLTYDCVQWLYQHGIVAEIQKEIQSINAGRQGGLPITVERTKFYLDIPDKIATMFMLRWS